MSGFTVGNKTIYKYLNTLKAGELVFFKKINMSIIITIGTSEK